MKKKAVAVQQLVLYILALFVLAFVLFLIIKTQREGTPVLEDIKNMFF
ncbi:hypothetical protein HYU13_04450 [Candidatus Woesearchaeota archaeon]|nr:hypothetical protein [Candidatus Woesearchaeota archaeon]